MFILLTKEMMNRANAKAQDEKPNCRMIVFGKYEVKGSKGNWYQIQIRADRISGYLVVDCNCDAGEHGNVCYHAASALKLHVAVKEAIETATV